MACVSGVLFLSSYASAQPTPLNSSIILFDQTTLDRAPAMVDRAAALGNRRVQVVVKLHCRLTPELKIKEYGLLADRRLQWRAPLHPRNFLAVDDERRREFTAGLTAVFRRAVERGMDLAVLLHLDAYGRVDEWRNLFDFDPLERYTGKSYAAALVLPVVDALSASRGERTRVQFSLAGEMGRSVFKHAASYEKIGGYVRKRLAPKQGGADRVEVGVSLNHNEVAGGHKLSDNKLSKGERRAVQRLINGCDFVGLSHYRPFEPPPRVEHFIGACDAFVAALENEGITLPAATPLHFSEVAIGGAPPRKGEAIPKLAAAEPWEGTGDVERSPWRSDEMRAFRRAYHDRLLAFLRTQPGRRRVAAAYLWSEGSWDPQGVGGRFADAEINGAVRTHNEAADRAKK